MIAALCFGALFGLPFIVWGMLLIVDRDRAWQKKRTRAASPLQRNRAWDMRQIIYGTLLIAFGIAILIALTLFNYAAQSLSPPAPF